MAFVSMILVYVFIFLAIILVLTFIGVILFLIAGFIALGARGKAKVMARPYRCPASVLVLRIIGTVFLSPILTVLGMILIAEIGSVVHPDDPSEYEEDYYEYDYEDDWDESMAYEIDGTQNAIVWIENYV